MTTTLAGRGREGALKGVAGDAVDQVGDRVGQESAADKIGDQMIPARWLLHGKLQSGFGLLVGFCGC
jgi:hypothetical protein